jgi:6-phosphofructokinase 1
VKKVKRIAVLTSGGDAPGMNAAIRAVVRTALNKKWGVLGVRNGYRGLIDDEMQPLDTTDVGGIIQQGGTILGSSRCEEFKSREGRLKGLALLEHRKIEALVVIGGNGSQAGSLALAELDFPVVGVASTIDNDIYGSEPSIGVDSALNIALEAIDRLKITASSHRRATLVEVMGRDHGYLALMAAIAGGAEAVVIPEVESDPDEVASIMRGAHRQGKDHALVVVAEGARYNAEAMAHHFKEHEDELGFKLRVVTLGHVQRGGAPGGFDRLLATRLGAAATEHLARGERSLLVGLLDGKIKSTALHEVATNKKELDLHLLDLARVLAA